MKKTKRILALVMALTLMFAFMAMSASAATIIMPRATCEHCGSFNARTDSTLVSTDYQGVSGCIKISSAHTHVIKLYKAVVICADCGKSKTTYTTISSCQ